MWALTRKFRGSDKAVSSVYINCMKALWIPHSREMPDTLIVQSKHYVDKVASQQEL